MKLTARSEAWAHGMVTVMAPAHHGVPERAQPD